MKRTMAFFSRRIITFFFLAMYVSGYSQDSLVMIPMDSFSLAIVGGTSYISFSSLALQPYSHTPQQEDSLFYNSHRQLISQLPTQKNAADYYSLACSLWELGKLREAEKMFLHILASKLPYFTKIYRYASDLPEDTTTSYYGYGSYTSHYKNSASIYLTKTYIETKQFNLALQYLNNAVNKYKVTYSCGTGYFMQQDQYRWMYATCYDGLKQSNKVLDLLLPHFIKWDDNIIIRAITRQYSADQIKAALITAEKSITCIVNTIPSCSWSYSLDSNGNSQTGDTAWFYNGRGTIRLFGKKVDLPPLTLEDGECASRERYVDMFTKSSFFTSLQELSHMVHLKINNVDSLEGAQVRISKKVGKYITIDPFGMFTYARFKNADNKIHSYKISTPTRINLSGFSPGTYDLVVSDYMKNVGLTLLIEE